MKKILLLLVILLCLPLVFASRDIGTIYHSTSEVNSIMKAYAVKYPTLVSYEVIGKSIGGTPIYMYKIGNPNGGSFMFEGRLHGPEDCGTESGLQFVKWVLESSDPDAASVRKNNYLLFIPVINVDSTRRQNLRRSYTIDGKTISVKYGVDLNRNFPTGWGGSGDWDGSSDPNDPYEYRGYSSASEPETKAVLYATNKYKPNIYMNTHCGGQYLNYRSYTTTTAKVIANIKSIASETGVNTWSYYSPGAGCGISGGHACGDASTRTNPVGNAWIFEMSTWANLPNTLAEYLTKIYPKTFPVYLGMAQAVQKTATTTTTELLHNPSFSVDDGFWRIWNTAANAVGTRTTTSGEYYSGPAGYRIKFYEFGSKASSILFYNTDEFSISSGKKYVLSFWAKATTPIKVDKIILHSGTSPYPNYFSSVTGNSPTISTSWAKYNVEFVASKSASDARVNFMLGTGGTNGMKLYLDNISIKAM